MNVFEENYVTWKISHHKISQNASTQPSGEGGIWRGREVGAQTFAVLVPVLFSMLKLFQNK